MDEKRLVDDQSSLSSTGISTISGQIDLEEILLHVGKCSLPSAYKRFESHNRVELQNSSINVESSTDVVIGSVTHFHGPVSIFHNGNLGETDLLDENQNGPLHDDDGRLIKADGVCPPKMPMCLSYKRYMYCAMGALCIIVALSISLTILFTRPGPPPFDDYPPEDNITEIGGHRFIYRREWGGLPPLYMVELIPPVPYVIVSHTDGPSCHTVPDCSERMRGFQDYHMNKLKSPDIGYNFLVGGDGNIYVGRGWRVRNFHSVAKSIGISFIGNYIYGQNELSDTMVDAVFRLIACGEQRKILTPSYKIVGHNQTLNTESPGENVYKVIKTWPHFDGDVNLKE